MTQAERRRPGRSYHRVLLKLSGDAFSPGDTGYGISTDSHWASWPAARRRGRPGRPVRRRRGRRQHLPRPPGAGIDRSRADYMGMLATVMNALALQDALEKIHVADAGPDGDPHGPDRGAVRPAPGDPAPGEGPRRVFAAGLGVPYFSTDTTAAQRALEIGAEAILKGTKVDGVYNADPHVDPTAQRFETIEYLDVLREGYQVMDATAISAVHGERPADHRVRLPGRGEHQPGRVGRTDRHPGPRGRPMTVDVAR